MGKLFIVYGDIVSEEILSLGDVIVNPTNPMMRPGGGVSGAIFRKAGVDKLENYTSETFGISYFNSPGKNEMKVGEVRVTPGFGLKQDIIFAQGPKLYDYPNQETALKMLLFTYKNIVSTAKIKGYKSILTPSIGTGEYGFNHSEIEDEVIGLLGNLAQNKDIDIHLVLYK